MPYVKIGKTYEKIIGAGSNGKPYKKHRKFKCRRKKKKKAFVFDSLTYDFKRMFKGA